MRYVLRQSIFKAYTSVPNAQWRRAYHRVKARFTTIDPKGSSVSYDTEIRVGEPHEAYVYIEPEIGNAIQSLVMRQMGIAVATQAPEKLPLRFNHTSRHFAYETLPLPRLDIPQDLPRQTLSDVSPATLWLSGNWHAITLDGTPDGE
ncbi:hypothetical protein CONLIGDRAFT_682423 [Coniochaeta ligniaria NRRL 30616]|uniref:Uncharacterized protein n=1 Tax=Coniochaeta ligniaria NRRL 30616 TaxID=1408157 RepID=A0A1J7IIR8_9PEZI|nr:hypothetical protein CONLIGDRAFT_682423 [Coniochaeta ligniaria NRRL 30616]